MMNVREVADYLNIKQRKVYDLVRLGRIPCSRVTGKWLFPQDLIDRWVAGNISGEAPPPPLPDAPPVVAGSHDPLLEWSLRESACGLALMAGGSLDGLRRLRAHEAQVCGLHVLDPASGDYNVPALEKLEGGRGLVAVEWAWRSQGLVLAPGNPLEIRTVKDLRDKHPRIVEREPDAGTHLLLAHLLHAEGVDPEALNLLPRVARSQTDVGLAILEGRADAGLAVEAVAHQLRLEFLPLHRERYDLAMQRRAYFDPPFQALLAFTRTDAFRERAAELGGYDVSGLGTVRFNGA
ncbi:MAG TPA: helix-turn-helix transcriptional regulator [bacterium]|nr:helix-turn-helix transcriptional regulator [bacterium]